MPAINKSLVVPYTSKQMYDLINDVESYPSFLPWCIGTKIHNQDQISLKASIMLAKGPVQHTITTINTMRPCELISMQYVAGPFKNCTGQWLFFTQNEGRDCKIVFNMQYDFANKLIAMAIEPIFTPIADKLIDAFYDRAKQIYNR